MADLLAGLGILLQVLSHHWANLFGSRAGNLQAGTQQTLLPKSFRNGHRNTTTGGTQPLGLAATPKATELFHGGRRRRIFQGLEKDFREQRVRH